MNRFNLTFRGEIIAGHDPEQVRTSLAEALAITDPAQLQQYFSGDRVVLRRNLERKEAAALYARLQGLGVQVELVKILERGDLHSEPEAKHSPAAAADAAAKAGTATASSDRYAASKTLRKADLAAQKALKKEDRAELKARERELKKALRAKQKEARSKRGSGAGQGKSPPPKPGMTMAEAAKLKALLQGQQEEATSKREAEREAARRAAEQAERERLEEIERQRRQAALEQQQAQERARREAQREVQARREAEERQRREAERAEQARREAEERQRREAERAEQARLAAERERVAAEQREQEKRRVEQLAARARVEAARRKREQAEEAARRKLEEARARARQQAELEEQAAQRREMEEQAIRRAAVELAHKPALKPVDARIKTRLETPSRQRPAAGAATPPGRKRQPGAPNLYNLRPFRNTPEIRARAGQSHRLMRLAFSAAAIALLAGLAVGAHLFGLATPAAISGAAAIVIEPQQGPLLLAADHLLLHDRAGVGSADIALGDLGLAALRAPLAFDADGRLLATGKAAGAGTPSQLLRCELAQSHCEPVSAALADTEVAALVVHPLDGSLFIADSRAGQLLKLSAGGELLARVDANIPAAPVLRLDAGLLMMNSAQGPAISVFRYEDEAFGQQLDEILLLPPGAGETSGVRDFLWSAEHWWVLLDQAGSDRAGLYRFDPQWQFVDRPPLPGNTRPANLVNWGSRTLVSDPSQLAIQRFNGAGQAEAPLLSDELAELADRQAHRANLVLLGWRIVLALCVLAAVAGVLLGALHRVRSLVYKSCRERGAEPIDKLADSVEWIAAAPERAASLRRTGITCAALATGLVLGAIGLGVSSLQLSALLVALAGPAAALLLLQRSEPAHIGVLGPELLLVDHDGLYQLGGGARIHYRGPFLMIDDVAVFTGTRLLPAFTPAQIAAQVAPLAVEGIRVDRKIVTVKLLQSRHPLALGAVAIAASVAAAASLLSLQGIF